MEKEKQLNSIQDNTLRTLGNTALTPYAEQLSGEPKLLSHEESRDNYIKKLETQVNAMRSAGASVAELSKAGDTAIALYNERKKQGKYIFSDDQLLESAFGKHYAIIQEPTPQGEWADLYAIRAANKRNKEALATVRADYDSELKKEPRQFITTQEIGFAPRSLTQPRKQYQMQQELDVLKGLEAKSDLSAKKAEGSKGFLKDLYTSATARPTKDNLTLGWSEIDKESALYNVLKKASKTPEKLSDAEKLIVQMSHDNQLAENFNATYDRNTIAHQAGEAMSYMPDFIVPAIATGGIANSVQTGLKAGIKTGVKKAVGPTISKLGNAALEMGVRGAITPLAMSSTPVNALDRLQDDYNVIPSNNGVTVKKTGDTSALEAIAKGYASNVAEASSEYAGGVISTGLGTVGKGLGLALSKVSPRTMGKLATLNNNVASYAKKGITSKVGNLYKRIGMDDMLSESLEENVSAVLDPILTGEFERLGDLTWDDALNTSLVAGVASLPFAGIKATSNIIDIAKAKQQTKRYNTQANAHLLKIEDENLRNNLSSLLDEGLGFTETNTKVNELLKPHQNNNGTLPTGLQANVLAYIANRSNADAINGATESAEAAQLYNSLKSDNVAKWESQTYKGDTSEGRYIATDQDGKQYLVLNEDIIGSKTNFTVQDTEGNISIIPEYQLNIIHHQSQNDYLENFDAEFKQKYPQQWEILNDSSQTNTQPASKVQSDVNLQKIEDENLRNNLSSLLDEGLGFTETNAKVYELLEPYRDINGALPTGLQANVLRYIANHSNADAINKPTEGTKATQFYNNLKAENVAQWEKLTYKGSANEGQYTATDQDGKHYFVLNEDIIGAKTHFTVQDTEGNVSVIPAQQLNIIHHQSQNDYLENFDAEFKQKYPQQWEILNDSSQTNTQTANKVQPNKVLTTIPKNYRGNITLTDGRTGQVIGESNGSYQVVIEDDNNIDTGGYVENVTFANIAYIGNKPIKNTPAQGNNSTQNNTTITHNNEEESPKQLSNQKTINFPRDTDGNINYTAITDVNLFVSGLESEFSDTEVTEVINEYIADCDKRLKNANRIEDVANRARTKIKIRKEKEFYNTVSSAITEKNKINRRVTYNTAKITNNENTHVSHNKNEEEKINDEINDDSESNNTFLEKPKNSTRVRKMLNKVIAGYTAGSDKALIKFISIAFKGKYKGDGYYINFTTPKGPITIRLSDTKANHKSFADKNTQANLSIVIEKYKTNFSTSDNVLSEVVYKSPKTKQEANELAETLLRCINKTLYSGIYVDDSRLATISPAPITEAKEDKLPYPKEDENGIIYFDIDKDYEDKATISNAPFNPVTEQKATAPISGIIGDNILQKWESAKKEVGKDDVFILPNGESLNGKWVITEAQSVTPSHDAHTLQPTNGFPLTEDGKNVNDNDYTNKRTAIVTMAQDYDARAITNPVIVQGGIVLSGNNRTMSGILASEQDRDAKYIAHLYRKATEKGFTSEQLEGFEHPRLVFEVDEASQMPLTTATFAKFNLAESKRKSPVDKAIVAGKILTSTHINQIGSILDEFDSLGELYKNSGAQQSIIDIAKNADLINDNDIVELLDGGALTDAGKSFVESLLVGSLLTEQNVRLLNQQGMRQYRKKIVSAIMPLTLNKKLKENIIDDLNLAITYIKEAQDNNMTLDELLLQINAFNSNAYDINAVFAALLLEEKTATFKKNITTLTNLLKEDTPSVFSGKKITKQEIYGEQEQQFTDAQRRTLELTRQQNKFATEQTQTDAYNTVQGRADDAESGAIDKPNAITSSTTETYVNNSDSDTDVRFKEKKAPLENSDTKSYPSSLDGTVDGNPDVSSNTQPDGTPLPNSSSTVYSAKLQKKATESKARIRKILNKGIDYSEITSTQAMFKSMTKIIGLIPNKKHNSFYSEFATPKGAVTIRLSNHKADGNNFVQNDSDENLSVVIESNRRSPKDSSTPYTEFVYQVPAGGAESISIVESILKGVYSVLDGNEYIDESGLAEKTIVRGNEVRFKREDKQNLQNINAQFNAELERQINNGVPRQGHVYSLGYPSEALMGAGVPYLPIELNARILAKKASVNYKSNHPFDLSDVKNLPEAIANPIAVFNSTQNNSTNSRETKVIFTELKSNGVNFVVALEINSKYKGIDSKISINSIRSLYPKNTIQGIIDWINSDNNLLLYVNKRKALDWLVQQQANSTDLNFPIKGLDSATKIIENFENPKISTESYYKNLIKEEVEFYQNEEAPQSGEKSVNAKINTLARQYNIDVQTVSTTEELPLHLAKKANGRHVLGLYDTTTDSVYFITNNIADEAQAEATFLHEVVAHKGLRGLLGHQFNGFLTSVWHDLDSNTQTRLIDDYGSRLVGTEEYIAELAEGGVSVNLFQRVAYSIRAFFRSLGMPLKMRDADIRMMLLKSANRMKRSSFMAKARALSAENTLSEQLSQPTTIDQVKAQSTSAYDYMRKSAEYPEIFFREIMEKRKAKTQRTKGVVNGVSVLGENIEEKLMDSGLSVRKMQAQLKKEGVAFDETNDIYNTMDKWQSIAQQKTETFNSDFINPLMSTIKTLSKKHNLQNEDIADYMLTKHSLEREGEYNENFKNAVSAFSKDGGKWNKDIAKEIVNNIEGKLSKQELAQLWQLTHNINDEILNIAVTSGRISIKEKQSITHRNWKYYVPLRGWDNEVDLSQETGDYVAILTHRMSESATRDIAAQKVKGRVSKPLNPVVTMMNVAEAEIRVGERNKLYQKVYNLAQNPNANSFVRVQEQWYQRDKDGNVTYLERPVTDGEREVYVDQVKNIEKLRGLYKKAKKAYQAAIDVDTPNWNEVEKLRKERNQAGEKITEAVESMQISRTERNITLRGVDDTYKSKIINGQKSSQHDIVVMVDGLAYNIKIADEAVRNAITGDNLGSFDNAVARGIGTYTRTLSTMFTQNNPAFAFSNHARDMLYALEYNATDNIDGTVRGFISNMKRAHRVCAKASLGKLNPLTVAECGIYDITTAKGLEVLTKEYANDKDRVLDTLYERFAIAGGETGFVQSAQLLDYAKRYENELKQEFEKGTAKGNVKSIAKAPLSYAMKGIGVMNDVAENSVRFANFVAQIEKGATVFEAVDYAKNVTVNFNRRGSWTGYVSPFYAFFNAMNRGVANDLNLLRKTPTRMVFRMAILATISCVTTLLRHLMDDDNDTQLADHTSLANYCIRITGNKLLTIPVPQNDLPAHTLGTLFADCIIGKKSIDEASNIWVKSLASYFSPFIPTNNDVVRGFVPTVAVPLYDIAKNETAFDYTVYQPSYGAGDEITPEHQRAKANVNNFLLASTQKLNELFGGSNDISAGVRQDGSVNEFKKWIADWNPSKVEHVITYNLGGVGTFASQAQRALKQAFSDTEFVEARNIPIISRFWKEEYNVDTQELYYINMKNLTNAYQSYRKHMATDGYNKNWASSKEEFIKDFKTLALTYKKFNNIKKEVNSLRDKMYDYPSGSDSYKELREQVNKTMEKANALVEQMN
ncbi:MAG: LPD38 domain-containing protein [Rikenellaceae bacterium]